jgi:hypothetical protein
MYDFSARSDKKISSSVQSKLPKRRCAFYLWPMTLRLLGWGSTYVNSMAAPKRAKAARTSQYVLQSHTVLHSPAWSPWACSNSAHSITHNLRKLRASPSVTTPKETEIAEYRSCLTQRKCSKTSIQLGSGHLPWMTRRRSAVGSHSLDLANVSLVPTSSGGK